MNRFEEQAEQAASILAGIIHTTPLTDSNELGRAVGAKVYLKQENLQVTNCCKARSAYFMLSRLLPAEKHHLVTVSTGNNGISMSWAMRKLGIPGTVFLPGTVKAHKVAAIRRNPVEVIFSGDDIVESEVTARAFAAERGATFRSPYNEWDAMFAQATIVREILEQLAALDEQLDAILVPVGGGGLIGGIAGFLRAVRPNVEIIGVQPDNSAIMAHSVRAGKILAMPSLPTLSDATAGGVEQGAITFEYCCDYVADYVLVSEEEIGQAMLLLHDWHGITVEGSGALAVAALLKRADHFKGKTVALLLCGANVDPLLLEQLKKA
uniref:Threonine dehydratase n=1 Tax=Candidatus Kentrum sp. UNK TaxID=2126344 RepID=A0A451AZC0_9GAMM|nr:MAG: threonine dehydratase [Candidatus Kentron sp. UNK]VFK71370.1 MAG: threonine dehydratase [Candidatus Kentron sp. UNK]